jgi:class 3 adenylate cyclase
MCRPTRLPYRGRLKWLGELSDVVRPVAVPGYWRQHVHKEIQPELDRHHGRLVKITGDGFLAEFASPVEAVRSALAIQDQLAKSINQAIRLRIGINLGDIIIEEMVM